MVKLKESVEIPGEDEFERKTEDRWRVLDLHKGTYRQRVIRVDKDGNDEVVETVVPLMNGKPLTFIPGVIGGAGGRGDQIDEPPLIDLVDKNIAHYQVNSDYRHGAHMTALPTLFLAGVTAPEGPNGTPGKIYIGGSAAITSSDPNAKGEFIEYKGQGLGAVEKMLDRIERQMALLGARMIADETRQAETLGATQIKRVGENSVLAKIVKGVSETLEWALGVFAEWAGAKGDIVYQINRDFLPAGMDAQQLNALLAAVTAGKMSSESFFDLLQRADLIDPEITFEDEQARIDSDPPPMPKPAMNDTGEDEVA
jgi:hypothetical protein